MPELPEDFNLGSILLVDKPRTWTSFDVVNKVRNETRAKKVGHAGTLDPLATGLLVICTGPFTKKINDIQAGEKEYTGTITLGATTASYDLESPPENEKDFSHVTPELIAQALKKFTGVISQKPPIHSAKKIDGERAYDLARRGEHVEVRIVEVEVKAFEITNIALPELSFRVACSKGTYIRSLANDLGAELGCGGHLSSLCRTRSGDFKLEDAWHLPDFIEKMKERRAEKDRV